MTDKNETEYIDVLDEAGNVTGVTKTKEQIHIDGDWHRAVHVWIVNSNNQVLLQRRAKTKINHPDMWDISVAGHISAGENSLNSALREVEEEIGVTLDKDDLEYLGELQSKSILNDGTYINNEIDDVYIVRKDVALEDMRKQDSEVDDLQYISIKEFKSWVENKNPELVYHPEDAQMLFNAL